MKFRQRRTVGAHHHQHMQKVITMGDKTISAPYNTLKGLKVFPNQQNVVNKFLISFFVVAIFDYVRTQTHANIDKDIILVLPYRKRRVGG